MRIYVDFGGDKPIRRVKVAEVKDFVRGEDAKIPIVSFDIEHGDQVLRWGTSAIGPSRDIDRFGIGTQRTQVRIVIIDSDEKIQPYCFIIEPKFTMMDTAVGGVNLPQVSKRFILIQESAFDFKDKWGTP